MIYNVEVQTGDEQIEALDSPVYMQIFGTTTTTPKLFLESKKASFTKNSTSKFIVSSNNVGEVIMHHFAERICLSNVLEDPTNYYWP